MRIALRDTATSKWKDKGNGGTTGNLTSGTVVSSSAISTFGIMTLADKFCTTLKPVATATDVTCPGNQNGTARVAASGATPPYTYNWSPRTGGSVSLWDLNAGTYHITVTDSRGCAISDSAIVHDPDSIHLSITTTPSDCHDSVGTAKITATGGAGNYSYFWIPNGEHTDSIWGLPAGIYEVVVTDAKGCSLDTTVNISDSDGPDVEVDSLVNVGCNGFDSGFARVIFSGDPVEHDPLWPCNVPNPERLAAGTYPVMMEDNDGCFTIVDVTISEPSQITLSVSTTQSLCGDSTGSATVTASGGTGAFTYKWSTGGEGYLEQNIPSGWDTVFVTDENGCVASATALIVDSNSLALSVTKTDLHCFLDSLGSASISINGGTAPFHYFWTSGLPDTSYQSNLKSDHYFVIVTDSSGCIQAIDFDITSVERLRCELKLIEPTTDSTSDGVAELIVSGGTPPYSYLWSPGNETSTFIDGLAKGVSYGFTMTDNNGCVSSKTFSFVSPCPGAGYGCHNQEPPCGVYNANLCIGQTICTRSITDFGAIPGDGISDHCAFEAAADFINTVVRNTSTISTFSLEFPYGEYEVGRQVPFNTGNNYCYYLRGQNVVNLVNCNTANQKISFVGLSGANCEKPIIKFSDCMRYGSFDPITGDRYIPCGADNFHDCDHGAIVGDIFYFENSENIEVVNLELDGNIENAVVGGYYSSANDGIQLPYDAIVIKNSKEIRIENVDAHSFGRDGLTIAPGSTHVSINLRLVNSKFNNNHRGGMAWSSGGNVFATGCQFNDNATTLFRSKTATGLDIEYEGGTDCQNGVFIDCTFNHNLLAGMISDSPRFDDGQKELHTHDFYFTRCTFTGTNDGYAIWPNARNFNFNCCNFIGHCQYAFDGQLERTSQGQPINNNYNTKFTGCTFSEEITGSNGTFSITQDCVSRCSQNLTNIPEHTFMIDFGDYSTTYLGISYVLHAGRVLFDGCIINSNFHNRLIRFVPTNTNVDDNRNILKNCIFNNHGLDCTPCASAICSPNYVCGGISQNGLLSLVRTNFIGTNILNYRKLNVVNAGFTDYSINTDDCIQNSNLTPVFPSYNWAYIYNAIIPFASVNLSSSHLCSDKYDDQIDLSLAIANCPQITEEIPTVCSIGQRQGGHIDPVQLTEIHDEIVVTPSPGSDYIIIMNVGVSEKFFIYNSLGELIINGISGGNENKVDISSCLPGIYLVHSPGKKAAHVIKY